MNNNRLSNSGNSEINKDYIKSEVARLLNGPSNYEIIKGRIFIKSLNKYQPLSFISIPIPFGSGSGLEKKKD